MRTWLMGLSIAVAACTESNEPPAVKRGRQTYMGVCIACHNMNPAVDGSLGPAVKGASRQLLEAKIVRGEYPPGHTPKRTTHVMPKQPQLQASLDDLAAFLGAP